MEKVIAGTQFYLDKDVVASKGEEEIFTIKKVFRGKVTVEWIHSDGSGSTKYPIDYALDAFNRGAWIPFSNNNSTQQ